MTSSQALERVARAAGYRSTRRYIARANFLFDSLDFQGKRVLDVGCGEGAWAIWAALHGAVQVLGIEPEADGASSGALVTFNTLVNELSLGDRVTTSAAFLEDVIECPLFDVAVLYNVINHLDENAVVVMHRDPVARARFVAKIKHLGTLLVPGAAVIVSDCGRNNLWDKLGLRSPLVPMMEWEKHHEPATWIATFREAGFRLIDTRWSPLYPFGKLSSNRFAQFITASQFVIRFRTPSTPSQDRGHAR